MCAADSLLPQLRATHYVADVDIRELALREHRPPCNPDIADLIARHRIDDLCGDIVQRLRLRPREIDVLERLVAGRRNRAIAEELGISENTVKFHISRILRRLGVDSRAEAVARVVDSRASAN